MAEVNQCSITLSPSFPFYKLRKDHINAGQKVVTETLICATPQKRFYKLLIFTTLQGILTFPPIRNTSVRS